MNKTIRSGARDIIYKVFTRCLAEYQGGTLLAELEDVYKRTAYLTGASTFTVMGSGTPLRQFMYSQDVAKLFLWTLRHYDSVAQRAMERSCYGFPCEMKYEIRRFAEVDNSDEVTIRYAAEQIARAFGYSGRIECDTSKPDGQHKRTASNSRLRSLYKDFQFTPFDRAIIDTM
ncbi:putative nad dependent epimerase/dehydratase [Operophtera brumata]|uniref:Putative nad dependent epimerase/dehydratase n=1 Tax=Operophtera brumata TaxID=104452 RepID=A0A0L7KY11_OPEBR|nr:putative nad dependent epimerase/dehydratase [Operophtera brumata]